METWVVAYDITDERHRRRCRRELRGLAEGYQKSVFELQAPTALLTPTLDALAQSLEERDSLLAARVLPFAHAWQLGQGPQSPGGDLVIIS